MRVNVVSLFPEFFTSPLETSLVGKAIDEGQLEVTIHDPRDHATGVHRQVDDDVRVTPVTVPRRPRIVR